MGPAKDVPSVVEVASYRIVRVGKNSWASITDFCDGGSRRGREGFRGGTGALVASCFSVMVNVDPDTLAAPAPLPDRAWLEEKMMRDRSSAPAQELDFDARLPDSEAMVGGEEPLDAYEHILTVRHTD